LLNGCQRQPFLFVTNVTAAFITAPEICLQINKMTLIDRLKSGWTALKFIRVALGILILSSSIGSGEVSGIILGTVFTVFSLFTDGVCCAGGSCYTPVKKNNSATPENIEYEELGSK
jgi:hypothetical protein